MPNTDSDERSPLQTEAVYACGRTSLKWFLIASAGLALAAGTATAQSNTIDVCNNGKFLPDLANGIIQLCILGGAVGGFVSYLGTTAMESMPSASEEQQQRMRNLRAKSLSAAVKVFAAGPVFLLLINFAGLPWADCIKPVPF